MPASGAVPEARYANHFQIGHNEYEFIFDFSQFHAPEPHEHGEVAGQVSIVRIVMGPTFSKALLNTLARSVAAYEQQFGAISLD